MFSVEKRWLGLVRPRDLNYYKDKVLNWIVGELIPWPQLKKMDVAIEIEFFGNREDCKYKIVTSFWKEEHILYQNVEIEYDDITGKEIGREYLSYKWTVIKQEMFIGQGWKVIGIMVTSPMSKTIFVGKL